MRHVDPRIGASERAETPKSGTENDLQRPTLTDTDLDKD